MSGFGGLYVPSRTIVPRVSSQFGSDVSICYDWRDNNAVTFNSSTSTGGTCRNYFTPAPSRNPRLVYANFAVVSGSGDALPSGIGPITIAQARIEYNSVIYPVTFNGQTSVTLSPGSWMVSDPLPIDIVGNSTDIIWARTQATWAAGQKINLGSLVSALSNSLFPNYVSSDKGGINYTTSTAGTASDQTATAGVAWATSNFGYGYGPIGLIGQLTTPAPVIAIMGDSIGQGLNDYGRSGVNAGNQMGYVLRGVSGAVDGSTTGNLGGGLTSARLALTGEKFTTYWLTTSAISRMFRTRMLDLCTDVVDQAGTNDLYNLTPRITSAALQAAKLAVWTMLGARGLKIWPCTLLPRTLSTDSFTNAGTQSPTVSALVEGYRTSYNTWLRAPASAGAGNSAMYDSGGLISGIIDAAALIEVNASNVITLNGGSWLTNGSANYYTLDGTHPNANGCVILQASISPLMFHL